MRVSDVADFFIVIRGMEGEDEMSNMRINMLLYFSQGYHLQRFNIPLFDEKIQAWQYGPIVESIYRKYQPFGQSPITETSPDFNRSNISSKEIDFLFDVYKELGRYSTSSLVEMSCKTGTPWARTYEQGEDNTIEVPLIKEYFNSLDPLPYKTFRMSSNVSTIGYINPETGRTVLPAEEYDEADDAEYENLKDAVDYAKFFLNQEKLSVSNTHDGNFKLQALLSFADMISLIRTGTRLFSEPVLANDNGFCIESVMAKYGKDYQGFKMDRDKIHPDFSPEEQKILSDTLGIFGHLSVRELSTIALTFPSWKKARCSNERVVSFEDEDLDMMRNVLDAYETEKEGNYHKEVINGSTFYIQEENVSEELMDKLVFFSKSCPIDSYTVILEDGEPVIF